VDRRRGKTIHSAPVVSSEGIDSNRDRLPLVPLKDPIKGLTARVREYEDGPRLVTSKRQRHGRPCGIEFGCERVFVLEPSEYLR
jgi:hypothetical protein